MKLPSQYQRITNLQLSLQKKCLEFFKTDLLGIYIFGSLAHGFFRAERSDIDLCVVVSCDIAIDIINDLDEMIGILKDEYPEYKDRLEIAFFNQKIYERMRQGNEYLLLMSPGEPLNYKLASDDWFINFYYMHQSHIVVYGPPIETFMPKISYDLFKEDVRRQARNWQQYIKNAQLSLGYKYYIVLTMARSVYAVNHSNFISKKAAGEYLIGKTKGWKRNLIIDAIAYFDSFGEQYEEEKEKRFSIGYEDLVRFIDELIIMIEGIVLKEKKALE